MGSIIVIDDSRTEHFIYKSLFKHSDCVSDIVYAFDGAVPLEFLVNHAFDASALPDAIFIEPCMREYSGWDFLDSLNALYPFFAKPIDIHIVTLSVSRMDRLRSYKYPFVKSFISKPVAHEQLIALCSNYLVVNEQ